VPPVTGSSWTDSVRKRRDLIIVWSSRLRQSSSSNYCAEKGSVLGGHLSCGVSLRHPSSSFSFGIYRNIPRHSVSHLPVRLTTMELSFPRKSRSA
jgi:hypothetical protein